MKTKSKLRTAILGVTATGLLLVGLHLEGCYIHREDLARQAVLLRKWGGYKRLPSSQLADRAFDCMMRGGMYSSTLIGEGEFIGRCTSPTDLDDLIRRSPSKPDANLIRI